MSPRSVVKTKETSSRLRTSATPCATSCGYWVRRSGMEKAKDKAGSAARHDESLPLWRSAQSGMSDRPLKQTKCVAERTDQHPNPLCVARVIVGFDRCPIRVVKAFGAFCFCWVAINPFRIFCRFRATGSAAGSVSTSSASELCSRSRAPAGRRQDSGWPRRLQWRRTSSAAGRKPLL